MNILHYGNGKLGKVFRQVCEDQNIEVTQFRGEIPENARHLDVAVYTGKGRHFSGMLEICDKLRIPLVNASTAVKALEPADPSFPLILVRNASPLIVNFMSTFPEMAKSLLKHSELKALESHQASKGDPSGTALAILKELEVDAEELQVVREPPLQIALGVPAIHLGWHAYHTFSFLSHDQEVEISVQVKVNGGRTYAVGLIRLIEDIFRVRPPLGRGVYIPDSTGTNGFRRVSP